jgi:dipeptidyl aminopeptidase/acylaminoacyl peptidase
LFSGARPTPTSRTPTLLCDLPDCTNVHEVPWRTGLWTPDGRGIVYVDRAVESRNIQVQPIDGGAVHPLTHFTDKQIDGFAWSPDGKRLIVIRSTRIVDIVLIKGFAGAAAGR